MGSRRPRHKKWLSEIPPSASYSKAARRILTARFDPILYYLPRAVRESVSDDQINDVHQLRVSVRRACAALEIMPGVLPPRRSVRVAKMLKKIRKNFGAARDLDVMMERLKTQATSPIPERSRQRVIEALAARRSVAQQRTRNAMESINEAKVVSRLKKLQDRVRWRGKATQPVWADVARDRLVTVAYRFFADADALFKYPDFRDHVDLIHKLRIRGKRLRYTTELAVSPFGAPLRAPYHFIAEAQKVLGEVNDRAVALDFYEEWLKHLIDPQLMEPIREVMKQESEALSAAASSLQRFLTVEGLRDYRSQWESVVGPLENKSVELALVDKSGNRKKRGSETKSTKKGA